jgi:hypothetical protein
LPDNIWTKPHETLLHRALLHPRHRQSPEERGRRQNRRAYGVRQSMSRPVGQRIKRNAGCRGSPLSGETQHPRFRKRAEVHFHFGSFFSVFLFCLI